MNTQLDQFKKDFEKTNTDFMNSSNICHQNNIGNPDAIKLCDYPNYESSHTQYRRTVGNLITYADELQKQIKYKEEEIKNLDTNNKQLAENLNKLLEDLKKEKAKVDTEILTSPNLGVWKNFSLLSAKVVTALSVIIFLSTFVFLVLIIKNTPLECVNKWPTNTKLIINFIVFWASIAGMGIGGKQIRAINKST